MKRWKGVAPGPLRTKLPWTRKDAGDRSKQERDQENGGGSGEREHPWERSLASCHWCKRRKDSGRVPGSVPGTFYNLPTSTTRNILSPQDTDEDRSSESGTGFPREWPRAKSGPWPGHPGDPSSLVSAGTAGRAMALAQGTDAEAQALFRAEFIQTEPNRKLGSSDSL